MNAATTRVHIAFADCEPQTVEFASAYFADRFAKYMRATYRCPVTVEDVCDCCGEWAEGVLEVTVGKRAEYWCSGCRDGEDDTDDAPRDCLAPLTDAGSRTCSCGAHS